MANVIARRVFDFLREYPPFNLLEEEVLSRVAERVVVQYRQKGETIYERGDLPGSYIYMVREGAVDLFTQEDGRERLVEHCDEGDVFGIRPLLAADAYTLTARTAEDTLLYAVNTEGFQREMESNPRLSYYLATSMASSLPETIQAQVKRRGQFFLSNTPDATILRLSELSSLDRSSEPITCAPDYLVREAAHTMTTRRVGSIIVIDAERRPLGIVTDHDLRAMIATGRFPLDAPVEAIMSSPVITIGRKRTVAEVQIAMLQHRIHHLCITEDGTVQTPVVGVISQHDLLVLQGNNPAVLIREIQRSGTAEQMLGVRERAEAMLQQYLYQEVAMPYIATIMTEINDQLFQRGLRLAEQSLRAEGKGDPPVPYCWMAIGSHGRGEQLLRTDQDHALVFQDVNEAEHQPVKNYFLQLADRVVELLYVVGFDYCPGDMMARNPRWCQSLQEWKDTFSEWIGVPTSDAILHSSTFFDFRPVDGDRSLTTGLSESILANLQRNDIFFSFMARTAVQKPPPLTFFRNFVVESSGEHKNEFDIKARAMMPLVDTARVLTLAAKLPGINNTFRRYERLAELEPQNQELYEEAADAYEILMRLRTLQGLKHENSGRYFNPAELSKMERLHLRNTFRPVKELQSLLNVRFQLAYFR